MNSSCISTFSACLNLSFLLPLCTLRCPAGVVFCLFFSQPWVGGHLRGVVQLLCSAVFVSLCENNLFGQKEIRVGPQLERTFLYTVRSKDEDGQTGDMERRLQAVKVTFCILVEFRFNYGARACLTRWCQRLTAWNRLNFSSENHSEKEGEVLRAFSSCSSL